MSQFLQRNPSQAGSVQNAYAWFDFTVPAGYVTGSGITVKVTAYGYVGVGSVSLGVVALTVNGGPLTSAPQGTPLTGNSGATLAVGAVVVPYCPVSAATNALTGSPVQYNFAVNGVNRNNDGWSGFPAFIAGGPLASSTGNGTSLPTSTGSGGATIVDGHTFSSLYPSGCGAVLQWDDSLPNGWSAQIAAMTYIPDLICGGVNGSVRWPAVHSAGPSPGSVSYAAGQTISICLISSGAAGGNVYVTDVTVDAGAGGVHDINLTSLYVIDSLSTSPAAGLPVRVSYPGQVESYPYQFPQFALGAAPATRSQGMILG